MNILTKKQKEKLIYNHYQQQNAEAKGSIDFMPVVKLFTPDTGATWLLTELDPHTEIAFGLCDLGQEFPELGYVSLQEISEVRGVLGLPVERDEYFKPKYRISKYAEIAREANHIIA